MTHTEVYEINMANSREEEFFKQTPGATSTGKSLSEALIRALTNPQYDD